MDEKQTEWTRESRTKSEHINTYLIEKNREGVYRSNKKTELFQRKSKHHFMVSTDLQRPEQLLLSGTRVVFHMI